jgi:hypothetical protein
MSFSSLRTLDFYYEATSKNLYSLFKFPLLDTDSAPPFAFEVCLNLCKSSGYPERRLRMSLTNLQWSANDACPSCRIICEGLQPCDLCDERAVIALSELGVSYCHVLRTGVYIASSPPLGHDHSYIYLHKHTTFHFHSLSRP